MDDSQNAGAGDAPNDSNAPELGLEPGAAEGAPRTTEQKVVAILERIAAALEQLVEQHGRGFLA